MSAATARLESRLPAHGDSLDCMVQNAVFASADMCAVVGPCGHAVPLDEAWQSVDHYACPKCGLAWHVSQEVPEIKPSGFVMPGRRWVHLDKQSNLPIRLPHPEDLACRKRLAVQKRPPLDRVMAQARASQGSLCLLNAEVR